MEEKTVPVVEELTKTDLAKLRLEEFIKNEMNAILTFTRERRLQIEVRESATEFSFDPVSYTLFVPLRPFFEEEIDHQMVLFNIYEVLAQYPDWKKYPEYYLNRFDRYQKEIEHIVLVFEKKVEMEGLQEDAKYSKHNLVSEASGLIGIVIMTLDHLYRYLRVLQLCPIYRKEEYGAKIQKFYDQNAYSFRYLDNEKLHEKIMDSFVCANVFGLDGCKDRTVQQFLCQPILKKPLIQFISDAFVRCIHKDEGVARRDDLICSYIMPSLLPYLEDEINGLDLQKDAEKGNDESGGQGGSYQKKAKLKQGLNQEDQEDLLEQMASDKKGNQTAKEDIRKGMIDLEEYKISRNDQQLFYKYANLIQPQRDAMKPFWMQLIGDAKKEEPFKQKYEPKGKLNVNTLIDSYPTFVEDMQRGNMKDVMIFDRYYLKPEARKLPRQIDISFVIDNSGSMEEVKIDIQRQALALTLLSLQDFDFYLKYNASILKQRIEVNTEVFYFGTGHTLIKRFDDKENEAKDLASTIASLARLDGKQGSTDDGGCLTAIYRRLSKDEIYEIQTGKRIHLVFEITDGASSFPKITKDALEDLQKVGVEVFAFKIGKQEEEEEAIFRRMFIEDHPSPIGMVVNDRIDELPTLLLSVAGSKLSKIFHR